MIFLHYRDGEDGFLVNPSYIVSAHASRYGGTALIVAHGGNGTDVSCAVSIKETLGQLTVALEKHREEQRR